MSAALDLSKGDRVEVHSRSAGPHQWIGGVVFKLAGKGAYVATDAGHENFYRWKEIRVMQKPESPRSGRRIVSLSTSHEPQRPELPVTLRSTTSLASAVVPGPIPVPPSPKPAVTAVERRPSPPHSRQTILMDLHPGATSKHLPRKLHDPTPIGNAFRAWRLQRGLAQNEMADRLHVSGGTLSQIELGDMVPNDDLVLAFAESTGTPLDELIKLRETSRVPASAPSVVSVVPAPAAPAAAPLPAPPEPLPSPPKPVLRPFSEVVVAVEAIVPMPADAGKRGRWLQVVAELYELREPQ